MTMDTCAHCAAGLERDAIFLCDGCRAAVCCRCFDDACPVAPYQGYTIERDRDHPHGGFRFTHHDYDGPPDDRCGHVFTLASAMEQIDDIEAMRADKLEGVE